MKNLNTLMASYFDETERTSQLDNVGKFINLREAKELPIIPFRNEWELLEDPGRLGRLFEFKSKESLTFFLGEILEYENVTGHNAKIIIDGMTVMIEVYTHDVNNVTELDTEYAQTTDEIYTDALSAYG